MKPALLLLLFSLAVHAQPVQPAVSISFTEGPTVAADGAVYFSDIMTSRIMMMKPDGKLAVYKQESNGANGLLIDPQGRLLACEGAAFERHGFQVKGIPRVTRTDMKTGAVEVLADHYEGKPFTGPNDLTLDSRGRIYFTDFTGSAVYRIDAPGKVTRLLGPAEVVRPNGIQVSPDDRTLYLVEADNTKQGKREIRAYDLLPDGSIRNMRVLYDFFPGRSADGMSIDSQGNLYASAGLHFPRGTAETLDTKCGVYVISPAGKLLRFIPIPEDTITNNAFGGPGMKTLYVTAGDTLYRVPVDIAGLPR